MKTPFSIFKYGWNLQKESFTKSQDQTNKGDIESFKNGIESSLNEAVLFDIDNTILKLLRLTKPSNKTFMFPFPNIFLNVKLEFDGFNIIGLLIREGEFFIKNEKVGKGLRISSLKQDDKEAIFFTFNPYANDGFKTLDNSHTNPLNSKLEKELKYFVYNFLNFINSPEVKIIDVIRNENNQKRRLKQNKEILPNSKKIIIQGVLRDYVNKLNSSGDIHLSYKFWVRGHFRTLKSQKWKDKIGVKIWIFPYIKGKGLLVKKSYELKEKNHNQ